MNSINPWLLLALAILTEVMATSCLKLSAGFTRLWPSILVVFGYVASFWLLSQVLLRLDLAVVYAIWCGVGIAVVAAIGVLLFGESLPPLRIAGLLAIMIGTVLLSLSAKGH